MNKKQETPPIEQQYTTVERFSITFISSDRLGPGLFKTIEEELSAESRKARTRNLKWIAQTLVRLNLIPSTNLQAAAIGCDHRGNYGLFIVLQPAKEIHS